MAQDLKETLQLPKTDFPMRAGLAQREPGRVAHWEKIRPLPRVQQRRADRPAFVLHDGPPFTNGDVHIGTALNKVLKDTVNRYKSMRGFRTPYVPGWDCHGLPIEQKVSRELQEKITLSTAELRAKCDAFSEQWIAKQTGQFKRLGVLADWANEYKTKDPKFEADIVRTFSAFIDQGLVYRSKKPVYWSIPFETALAEAEIEYKDHISPSIWVKFKAPPTNSRSSHCLRTSRSPVVIWTTTPWTIPANLAIAVHPEVDYVVADLGAERIVVAAALLPAVLKAAKIEATPAVVATVKGATLENLQPRHPFIDRASPVVVADYVTTDSGTGCRARRPGHGAEDYQTGLRYKLEIYCPVGDDGCYVDDGRVPADLVGLGALESVEDLAAKKTSAANIAVLKNSTQRARCWPRSVSATATRIAGVPRRRSSSAPLTNGSSRSISVGIAVSPCARSSASRRTRAGFPLRGEARIRGAIESRPDWCISRQRSWGVPIPAFYDEEKGVSRRRRRPRGRRQVRPARHQSLVQRLRR
jgi:isoleucyl-tRNA synthetase